MQLPLKLVRYPGTHIASDIRDADNKLICKMVAAGEAEDLLGERIIYFCNEFEGVLRLCEQWRRLSSESAGHVERLMEQMTSGAPVLADSAKIALMAIRLVQACAPLVNFVNKWDAKPIAGVDDCLYSIHGGNVNNEGIGADIRLSDLRKLKTVIGSPGPDVAEINATLDKLKDEHSVQPK